MKLTLQEYTIFGPWAMGPGPGPLAQRPLPGTWAQTQLLNFQIFNFPTSSFTFPTLNFPAFQCYNFSTYGRLQLLKFSNCSTSQLPNVQLFNCMYVSTCVTFRFQDST